MLKTRITELFGIKYPIIQAALGGGLSNAELAAAVSNAGGLGIIAGLAFSPQTLREEIKKTKSLTDKPFAINIAMLPSNRPIKYEDYFDAVIGEGVKVVETVGQSPEAYIKPLKDAGVKVMHKAGAVRHARSAERAGVDAVSIVSVEGAGHPLPDEVASSVLIPACVDALKIPVVAAGGIADARGLVAALALGAEGVMMGTRFVVTQECIANPKIKEWFVQLTEADTMIIQRSIRFLNRVAKTDYTQKIREMEEKGAKPEEIISLTRGSGNAYRTGDTTAAIVTVGQSVGLVHDIPTVKELIDRLVSEADLVGKRLHNMGLTV